MRNNVTTKRDKLPTMSKAVEALAGRNVYAGVLDGEHAWLAGIHEYGCKITVTPKMRAWFAYQGYPLKKSTTVITIPERSFIRAGYDTNIKDIRAQVDAVVGDVASGSMSAEQFLKMTGILLQSAIKDYATDLKSPGNSGMTADRKGSSNPLVDTGDMIGGITYKVE